jgi:endonuclease/exonuclease/phosphatase family metal-dependent hydrolase
MAGGSSDFSMIFHGTCVMKPCFFMPPSRLLLLFVCVALTARAQQVFINEFHYDNSGTDENEGIEIAGPAGTLLSDYEIVLYNGNGGAPYGGTLRLSGVIPNQSGGAGAVWFGLTGIQNDNDGMVLVHWPSATVVQRISYEGSFTAVGGAANGQVLPDIGVAETSGTSVTQSLQLTGTGTQLSQFTWAGPRSASRGSLNAGQTFTATPVRTAAMLISPGQLKEGDPATLSLTLSPAPGAPVTFTLSAMKQGLLALPAEITVNAAGMASVPVAALTDGEADGFQETGVLAQPADPQWTAAAAGVQIVDADRAFTSVPGALRVMSLNVRFGVGSPGSAEFNAVREVVERLSPDVLVMQEVAGANVFADWLSLVQQCGFPNDAAHIALVGDAFAGQPFSNGDLSGNLDQNLVTVSRYPIRQRVQIGRGSGRSEITRYPILTVVDVPSLPDAQDPVIVNVHLKADTGDANNFRRALEALRTREALTAGGFTGGNVIICGDFNATYWLPQPASYQTNVPAITQPATGQFPDGTMLPQSFSAGSDLTSPGFTLPYATFPHSGFTPLGLSALNLEQLDGNEQTFAFAAYKLDYFFVSPAIAARGAVPTEIYNSRLEHLHDGLPKRRTLPAPSLSTTAADHYAIVADLPLVHQPSLSVTFSRDWVNEGDTGLTATITATPAPAVPVTVSLNAWRDARIPPMPSRITLGPGHASVMVPVDVPWLPGLEPHRSVALTASATGCFSGTGSVEVRNREASGLLVISQYTEPVTGSAPRALELLNVSGSDLNFANTPLQIRRYSNGDADGLVDALAESGVLPPGAVLVVGDDATGDYMVAQGLIPAPATPFSQQLDHTVFLNAAGKAAFVLDQLVFTGNDAFEVLVDGTRSDVLSEIGHDPGTAWTGPGPESTANGTLTLRTNIATGSSGWRQPGLRFTFVAGGGLEDFGIAPSMNDPYLAWAAGFGLKGLDAAPAGDPDGDGVRNLAEYGLLSSPVNAADSAQLTILPAGFSRRMRTNDATLTFTVESSSASLASWNPAAGTDTNGTVFGDGSMERTFTLAGAQPGRVFLRQQVSRP